ncbi:type II toxin-antitoxin system RelE/ParE family toxin [Rhizobium sp. TRM95111]|uniref:type II toxin-antitoxin system RelE/ParE family toxin n=1 Tax=Rhizobium alarense TaxID=2846851 RepID=UPI001F31FBA6|nr:type II toxin-antitoxin system RelE/ParE family toxin [Rhizobium alarense]MCF3641542.1 type II toxin-antitoxin system RelE/ParE family toxin [Rhizobium alarense]
MTWRLTREAERDLTEIARHTVETFGRDQAMHYAALIERALTMLSDDPLRPSSRAREELAPAVRSFHLAHASPRRHAASHVVYYHRAAGSAKDIIVLRVLHERMEPKRRLADARRRDEQTGKKP